MRKIFIIIFILFISCSKEDNSALIAQYEEQISNYNSKINDLTNQVSDLTNQVSGLNSQLNNSQAENNNLTNNNNSLNEQLSEVLNSNTEIQSLYDELQSLYDIIEEDYNSLAESVSTVSIVSLSSQNSLLYEQIDALTQQIDALTLQLINSQLETSTANDTILSLQVQLGNVTSATASSTTLVQLGNVTSATASSTTLETTTLETTSSETTTLETTSSETTVQYQLTVNTDDRGSVSSTGGTYDSGSNISITASANSGSVFVNWTDSGGNVLSTNTTYSTQINADLTISANFVEIPLGNFQIGSLEFYNGNLYVGTSNKILKLDSAGNISTYLGAGGEIDIDIDIAGESDFITGLVFDNNGALYFGGDRTVRKLVGSQITTIYSNGVSTGGIVVNSNNDIFISMCCADKTMRKVDQNGNVGPFTNLGGNVYGSDIKNDIIYLAYSTGEIKTISSISGLSDTGSANPGTIHTINSVIDFLTSIKIDQSGNLYILNSSNSSNGKLIKVVNGSETVLITDLWQTRGLDFDDNGNLYVGDMGRIHKVAPDGTVSVFMNTRQ